MFQTVNPVQVIPSSSLRGADQDTIRRLVEESEADVIIHTAAISDIGQCQADPAMPGRTKHADLTSIFGKSKARTAENP